MEFKKATFIAAFIGVFLAGTLAVFSEGYDWNFLNFIIILITSLTLSFLGGIT